MYPANPHLRKQNEAFIKRMNEDEPHFFERLTEGQTPEYFLIACSDSRVSPSVIIQMPLGQMFIHRNIANQVNHTDESLTASLYYALVHLKVKKIIIQGHTNCGGIKAASEGNNEREWSHWLSHIHQSLPSDHTTLSNEQLAKENVVQQISNLKKHTVFEAYGGDDVEIYGCLFHMETGKIVNVSNE